MPSRRRGEPGHAHPHHTHNHPQAYFHVEFGLAWPARHPRRPDYPGPDYPGPDYSRLDYPRASRGQSEPPPRAALWKDLPALPSNYRLGEGLPWDLAADPAADPDDLEILPYTRPTVVPIESAAKRDEDPQRMRNLEALSAAMMTVDNGFESQWWNRGHKVPTVETAVESMPMMTTTIETAPTRPSLGWAVAEPRPARQPMPLLPSHRPAFSPSPVSPKTHASLCTFGVPDMPHHDLHERRDTVSPESESASVVVPWSEGSHSRGSSFGSSMPRRRKSSEELFLAAGYMPHR